MVKKLCIGIRLESVDDIRTARSEAHGVRYDYLCTRIVPPSCTEKLLASKDDRVLEPFTFSDLTFTSNEWASSIVGAISNLGEHLTSKATSVRKKAVELINNEIEYCQHLCLAAIIVEADAISFHDVAEIIHSKIDKIYNYKFWVRVPMILEPTRCSETGESNHRSGWDIWTKFHTECRFDTHVGVALEISADIPDEEEIKRWLGEPIMCIVIPTDIFMSNPKGYPVLAKAHQKLLQRFFSLVATVLIEVTGPFKPEQHKYYQQYVEHMFKQWEDRDSEDPFNVGYGDYLQAPLQPLKDNLESQIYEVFEKDPVKYELYKDAISKAILTLQPNESDSKLTLMVVGAGRGPIVTAAILASQQTGRPVRLYAVEKNRNAVNTLLVLNRTKWAAMGADVTIIHSDMRTWNPDEKADIIISELLGSFGDNELSPECLDGAQKFLKDDGIMIPARYTSYLAPIMSAKLHFETNAMRYATLEKSSLTAHFETPYVVHMKNKYDIDAPKPLFEFHHPNNDLNGDNDRFKVLNFHPAVDCVLHGFAGYFESDLYDHTIMSIYPPTFSNGMFSWYPIFFPIRTPIHLKKSDTITVRFKRCSSDRSVWYEWSVISPTVVSTHNLKGSAYSIGL